MIAKCNANRFEHRLLCLFPTTVFHLPQLFPELIIDVSFWSAMCRSPLENIVYEVILSSLVMPWVFCLSHLDSL